MGRQASMGLLKQTCVSTPTKEEAHHVQHPNSVDVTQAHIPWNKAG